MRINDLETPALLIDHKIMIRNLKRMQSLTDSHETFLRPHTKTHKLPEIAKLQLNESASGICVQKLSEAEVMVKAGESRSCRNCPSRVMRNINKRQTTIRIDECLRIGV